MQYQKFKYWVDVTAMDMDHFVHWSLIYITVIVITIQLEETVKHVSQDLTIVNGHQNRNAYVRCSVACTVITCVYRL